MNVLVAIAVSTNQQPVNLFLSDEDVATVPGPPTPNRNRVKARDSTEVLEAVVNDNNLKPEDLSGGELEKIVIVEGDDDNNDDDGDGKEEVKRKPQGKWKKKEKTSILMDDRSDLDEKVAAAKKKWRTASVGAKAAEDDDNDDQDAAATLPPRHHRSAKKRVVYFTKSDWETESDEDGDDAPKKGSAKKKADTSNGKGRGKKASKGSGGKKRMSTDSNSDEFADSRIVAPADLSSLPLALSSSLTDKSMDFDELGNGVR